jgi:translocator protein
MLMENKKTFLRFIVSILIPIAVGISAGILTASSVSSWYATLTKPSFNPPNWIFAPVWNLLYFLMGLALFIVWQKEKENPNFKKAVWIFAIQLALNFFWSLIFFGFHSPGLALLEIIFLWLSIVLNIFYFSKISKISAWLLVPYILWVSFAAFLNFSLWRLN